MSEKLSKEAENILTERFGKDSVIALATTENGTPYVRYVNGFYDAGAFYVITHRLSGKMMQIKNNPEVAIAGEWFTAHGAGIDMGYFEAEENDKKKKKLRLAFEEWIDNGHNDFNDKNTIILCIRLTNGTLFSNGKRYEIEF